jgi:hypothetical protein
MDYLQLNSEHKTFIEYNKLQNSLVRIIIIIYIDK